MKNKKIGPDFAVKSTSSFELYKAFKVIAEDIGYVYNQGFTPFSIAQMNYADCLYFAKDWDELDEGTHAFSFSNVGDGEVPTFDLEEDFNGAVKHAKAAFNAEKEDDDAPISITVEGIEDWDIYITPKTGEVSIEGERLTFKQIRSIYEAALSEITDHLED